MDHNTSSNITLVVIVMNSSFFNNNINDYKRSICNTFSIAGTDILAYSNKFGRTSTIYISNYARCHYYLINMTEVF